MTTRAILNADRATFSAPPEIMAKARAKARGRKQKFSTYIAALVELDVLGGGKAASADDLMLSAAEDVIHLRKTKPAHLAHLIACLHKGKPFPAVVMELPDLAAEDLMRLRRAYVFLSPTAIGLGLFGVNEEPVPYGEIPNSPVAELIQKVQKDTGASGAPSAAAASRSQRQAKPHSS